MPPTTKLIIDNLITVLGLTLLYTLPCMVVIFAIRAYKCLVIATVVNHGLLAGVALLLVTAISLPVLVRSIYKYEQREDTILKPARLIRQARYDTPSRP